jgi:hypothetical protein
MMPLQLLLVPRGVDGKKGGGEGVKGRCERSAYVPDTEGDEIHSFPVFVEGRD